MDKKVLQEEEARLGSLERKLASLQTDFKKTSDAVQGVLGFMGLPGGGGFGLSGQAGPAKAEKAGKQQREYRAVQPKAEEEVAPAREGGAPVACHARVGVGGPSYRQIGAQAASLVHSCTGRHLQQPCNP